MRDQHGPPLEIPIAEAAKLVPHYGWSFALTLFTGILCILVGVVVYYLYLQFPEVLYEFFDHDVLEEEDFLELQRNIDEGDGYAKTWGQKEQQEGITATGEIVKVPGGDVESGRSQPQENSTQLRKSRRSKRVRSSKHSQHGKRPNLMAVTEEEEESSAAAAGGTANGDMEMKKISMGDALRSSIKRKKKGTAEEETAIHTAMEVEEERQFPEVV